jgi:hypothetical protein
MGPSDREHDDPSPRDGSPLEDRPPHSGPESRVGDTEMSWLGEIVEQLEYDPGECWPAIESLVAIEPAMRRAIIAELSNHRTKPGVRTLLRLLSAARDPSTRSMARMALPERESEPIAIVRQLEVGPSDPGRTGLVPAFPSARRPGAELEVDSRSDSSPLDRLQTPIVRSLVTPVDGQGRGTIVVSIRQSDQRRTAAFWCDVQQGILDVLGDVEPDIPSAGRLLDEWVDQTGGDCASDVPWLAVRLLGGSLLLCGSAVPGPVRDWLDGTLGPTFQPSGFPGFVPGLEEVAIPAQELAARAHDVLNACPSWLDRSALTFELAEEITLREGLAAPDPDRDSGAYRFLFEHLLIHRLELYRRMLFWMAWVWQGSGRTELARSAFALACQLSDEQYEVPSHPFTVALSTRSLEAAQARLRTSDDPRRNHR